MKNTIILFIFLSLPSQIRAQHWAPEKIKKANTAVNATYLSDKEKEIIMYINLARLFPFEFSQIEVKNYKGPFINNLEHSPYKKSLMNDLKKATSKPALLPDKLMTELADCLVKEQGPTGEIGHDRKYCKTGYGGECCSYGLDDPLKIVLQLLIDHDVPGLGHRKILLNGNYKSAGVRIGSHSVYNNMAVIDLSF
jgi:hypothetical protein